MIRETCEYEWQNGAQCERRIHDFLLDTNEDFVPKLSGRVDMKAYARKLAQYADNLFVVIDMQDAASCSIYCNEAVAFISSIAVKKDFWRLHIGTQLMDEVKRHAKERKCTKICLEVHEENAAALAFYQSCGFYTVTCRENWMTMEYILH